MVPSRHTMMNIHRKMRSITMATYFQSSFTCVVEEEEVLSKSIVLIQTLRDQQQQTL